MLLYKVIESTVLIGKYKGKVCHHGVPTGMQFQFKRQKYHLPGVFNNDKQGHSLQYVD